MKTSLDPAPQADEASSGRGGRLRQQVVAKKKEEYQDYAEQMKAVAQEYLPPDKDLIQSANAKGNVSFAPGAGEPGEVNILIRDYAKAGDSMSIVFDKAQKQLVSVNIATYLSQPSDAMKLAVTFARIPGGSSHAESTTIDGISKQLTVVTQNSSYTKRD